MKKLKTELSKALNIMKGDSKYSRELLELTRLLLIKLKEVQ